MQKEARNECVKNGIDGMGTGVGTGGGGSGM